METKKHKTPMQKLVDRLCARPAQDTADFDVDPQVIRNEIGDALMRHSANLEHATRIVEKLVYDRWRPGPLEIQLAAEETILPGERAAQVIMKPDPACSACDGTGWMPVSRGGLSGVARCACSAPRPRGNEQPELGTPEGGRLEPEKRLVRAGAVLGAEFTDL